MAPVRTRHIKVRVQQASEERNPMAISSLLNPSKDPESRDVSYLRERKRPVLNGSRWSPFRANSPRYQPRMQAARPPHSNKPYTTEQRDWIRYHHDDLGNAWKSLPVKFQAVFSTETRDSDQCFSSRYYRDNRVPDHNNWKPILDSDGKPRLMSAKVRERQTPEGRELDIPFKLVEKHPERALTYSWVEPAHKEAALIIMQEDEVLNRGVIPESDQQIKKWRWRKLIRDLEEDESL